jgi:CRISPR/Cas system CSM-associated protein Csm3 (group 7 of RAMP superfamily)|uniref:CRISPR type III-associated protein domain-containing protein n=1 Tax=candidate division WOR-3 bacterium TaxID=2052148 RepID=A0A7C4UGJ1_UNCW3
MDKFLVIEVYAKTISPLYTGEIKKEAIREARDVNLPVRRTEDGKVAIPIYGVIRAYLEKILTEKGENVCDTGAKGAKGCGRCVLCDLFGYLGRRGRAFIDDLVSKENAMKIVSSVTHNRIDRNSGTVSDALKMEEIKEGSEFYGKIRIIEPKERDIELFATAFEAMKEFGIGGWVTRGRGRVDIQFKVYERRWTEFINRAKETLKQIGIK